MSSLQIKAYRFSTPAHWGSCVLQSFNVSADGTLVPAPRLGLQPVLLTAAGPVTQVAIDHEGHAVFRRESAAGTRVQRWREAPAHATEFEPDALLAHGPRWLFGRDWMWAFEGCVVARYDAHTLEPDFSLQLSQRIVDLASDGREGCWLLLHTVAGYALKHIDCQTRQSPLALLPAATGQVLQLVSTQRGSRLGLLGRAGETLFILAADSFTVLRALPVSQLSPLTRVRSLTSDGVEHMALWDPADVDGAWALSILSGAGDSLDRPLITRSVPAPHALAIAGNSLWLGSDQGLWRLDTSDAASARETDGTLLTPLLHSPDGSTERGWLRAELTTELPRGAVIDVQVASTDDPTVAEAARQKARDPNLNSADKQAAIWQLLTPHDNLRTSLAGPSQGAGSLSVPLFETEDRWLWLRVNVVTPPGTPAPELRALHVLYPNLTIAENLPAIFRGERFDPTGFMRRLVGVLETTTQQLDERIQEIARALDPATAPLAWLDYLGRWLDLPWDDALTQDVKRALLAHAGALLGQRGTRAGLLLLLRCLVGPTGTVSVTDLTVDYTPGRLGGPGRPGPRLPMLLAGASPKVALLDGAASIGRTRLACDTDACDPLATLPPTLSIVLQSSHAKIEALAPLLPDLLAQYVPAAVCCKLRFVAHSRFVEAFGPLADGTQVLDSNGPGSLDDDSVLGRTVLSGKRTNHVDGGTLGTGYRLQ